MINNFTEDDKNRLFMTLDAQTEDLRKLKQGMYGDKELGIKGLIKESDECKTWRQGLKIKIAFLSGVAFTIWEAIKEFLEWLTNKHNS